MICSNPVFGAACLGFIALSGCQRENRPAPRTETARLAEPAPAPSAPAAEESPYLTELRNFFETVRNHYGPLELKRETIGYDYEAARSKAFAEAGTMKSSSDFYAIVAGFLNGLNDAHVSITLPTSLTYTLPIQMSYVEGKFIVNYIDRNKLPKEKCGVQVGDELVRMNGEKPLDIEASDPAFRKDGNDRTNAAYFARMLSNLRESSGVPLANLNLDSAKFEFARENGSGFQCAIPYEKSGTGLIGREIPAAPSLGLASNGSAFSMGGDDGDGIPEFLKNPRFLKLNRLMESWHRLVNTASGVDDRLAQVPEKIPGRKGLPPKFEGKKISIGGKEPFFALPKDFRRIRPNLLGRPIIALANGFYAGTFKRNGKRVGFLRIPSYEPTLAYLMSFGVRYFISELEAQSDVLVIDQTNNPGGAVLLSDLVVKGLTGKIDPANHMRFRMKPTQSFLRTYAGMIDLINQDANDPSAAGGLFTAEERKYFMGEMRKNYAIIESAFMKGESLSDPVSMSIMTEFFETAIDRLVAKVPLKGVIEALIGGKVFTAQTYTKPVYFMINELDFSGGDATPAVLQDYGRVKLVGVRTAGAGGTVEEFSSRVTSDLKFRLTTSLMYRKGGKYVENYGVHPDLAFELTRADYRDGFTGTFERFLKTIGL